MTTVILSIVIFAVVVAGMAIGVFFGRKPMKGSCGGMSALGMDTACDICGGDANKCEEEQQRQKKSKQDKTELAYEAGTNNKNT